MQQQARQPRVIPLPPRRTPEDWLREAEAAYDADKAPDAMAAALIAIAADLVRDNR